MLFNANTDTFQSRAVKLTGPFVTMIFSMITGDMFTFSIIYVIFLFGFSQVESNKKFGVEKVYFQTA